MKAEINEYIVADSEICHGKPVFKGTRITVFVILEMLKEGASTDDILRAYPSLTKVHIKAALEFAANLAKQNRIPT
ncbi:DUF433 domain-containing protein [Candidatus Pacearchaeota archaeon]|nr:DUF433 domain-containing protein [Candidatus Pacearchaeota archaeon]MBD3283689.1 DUF433 domain-containing protein [Candidatus Pacearchaeota archaeon]